MTSRPVFQAELRTRDLRNAVPFYRRVFDWKFYPASADYALVDTGALPLIGILQTANPIFPLGVVNNILVDDCERESARAVALGGRVSVPRSEVPGSGQYVGVVDPWGSELFLWQPFTDERPKPQGSGANPISYVEISAPDLNAAVRYYSELTGWDFTGVTFQDGLAMARGCGLKRGVGIVQGSPGILDYVDVASVAETISRVSDAGGQILVGPTAFPGEGTYMIFGDLDGVAMGVIEGEKAAVPA